MNVLILGASGMIGGKLARRLAGDGSLAGKAISQLVLHDIVPCDVPAGIPVSRCAGDLSRAGEAKRIVAARPDMIFHLAAIVSGEAEQDFDKGYRINMDGTRALLEAIRAAGTRPRLVFASSIAAFGAPFPEAIDDCFFNTPLTSYGTQKTISELLISDYSRKGFVDGISVRLPTICVRPGKPNRAASGFFSNIIREPLAGHEAVLPVSDGVKHWFASPRAALGFLLHAASLDLAAVGPRRAITMPGVAATVGEQIAALRKVAGDAVARRIRRQPDPVLEGIVAGWPRNFSPKRALELGFTADRNFEEIIRIHIDDELDGRVV